MPKLKKKLWIFGSTIIYNLFLKGCILRRVRRQEKVNVVFFAVNVAMWKYDGFFKLLLEDPRFNPVIVSYLYPGDGEEYRRFVQREMKEFFGAKGYPFFESYDFDSGNFLDVKAMKPDIIFYAQPYDNGYSPYRIKNFIGRSLFAYIPYCYHMEDDASFYDCQLHKIAWRLFYPTEHHARQVAKYSRSAGRSVVVTGYPMADRLLSDAPVDYSSWKDKSPAVKRVIWAPHHSIMPGDVLDNSRFLELADVMVSIARKYQGKLQFAFKPHPRLKPKLYLHPSWGQEKTDAYYRLWEEMPDTVFQDGDYVELFRSSDAMLHDCSSFMGEYLYFNKPVAFLGNRESVSSHLNDFAKGCLACHYQADNQADIEAFLENVVLGGKDAMEPARSAFRSTLVVDGSVAGRMYEAFKAGLESSGTGAR